MNSKENNKKKKNLANYNNINIQSLFNNKNKLKNDIKSRRRNIKTNINDNVNIQKEDSNNDINYNYKEMENKLEKKKEIEDNKNCDISSQDNSVYDNDFIIKNTKIKPNVLYVKCKMNRIPYKSKKNINNENRPSFRITWSKKDNKFDSSSKELKRKSGSNIKSHLNLNLLEEDSSSHNTIYDDENNVDYDYINKFNSKNGEKLYKKIVMRKMKKYLKKQI